METDFVAWFETERERRGWNQAELARRAEISDSTLSKVIDGIRGPGLDFLRGVASAFGVPLETVMREAGILPKMTALPDEAKDWGARLAALPDHMRGGTVAAMNDVLRHFEELLPARSRSPR